MDVFKATKVYETWLGQRIPLVETDLRLKHQRMTQSPFPFLRATFYRWVQLWPQVCPELANAPVVLGIGDLHIENFGTWRDGEGRLVWGVNDFDEVARMPYANDLVRLAVSARLAIRETHLGCEPTDACDAILAGYRESITKGGAPFLLAEEHHWLRDLANSGLRDPALYWPRFSQLPPVRAGVPPAIKTALRQALPEAHLPFRIVHRQAGLGSLGRRRFTALAQWRGGWVAREGKELVGSAWHWETGRGGSSEILYAAAIAQAVRVPNPFVGCKGHWLIRRLAPDCSRVELASLPKTRDELKLLRAMGWESANIHLGTATARSRILKDLEQRHGNWFRRTTAAMTEAVIADWKKWAKG